MKPFLRGALTGCVALLFAPLFLAPGCAAITPGERDALVAGNAVACTALTLIPVVGPLVATACAGEEQLVRDALDHAVEAQKDGGPETEAPSPLLATNHRASPEPTAPAASAQAAIVAAGPPPPSPSHVALYHRRGRHRRHVGYAPLRLAGACQGWLDAHPDGVPRPEVAAMPWDGGR